MAGPRYRYHRYIRRVKFITFSPAFQLFAICFCLFTVFRWVLRHNHDGDVAVINISVDDEGIDWSRFYYAMFVRSERELCEALMGWSELEEIGSRGKRIMFHPEDWGIDDETGTAQLLRAAEKLYYVHLSPLPALRENTMWTTGPGMGAEGLDPKILAFNLTEYSRVLVLSPGSLLLQNLDELFLLPNAPIAMPWVYHDHGERGWEYDMRTMLIQPDAKYFQYLIGLYSSSIAPPNPKPTPALKLLYSKFGGKILRIPQRPYHLTTNEFRRDDHTPYLTHNSLSGNGEGWDPDEILKEAKILHFHDPGFPRPWIKAERRMMNQFMPGCKVRDGFGASDCRDRYIWLGLYRSFGVRRGGVCGVDFDVQPKDERDERAVGAKIEEKRDDGFED